MIPRKSVSVRKQLCIAVTMVTRPFVDMFVENSKNDYFFAKCIKKENKVTYVKKKNLLLASKMRLMNLCGCKSVG